MEVRRNRRWFVVAGLTAAAAAVPVVSLPASGSTTDAARLRGLMLGSDGIAHQGYAESVGRLAVPELPKLASVTSMLTGTTQMRTWYNGRDQFRFDVLNTANERDVYRFEGAEYVWDYGEGTLTAVPELPIRLPRAGDLLPPDLARRILAAAPGDPVHGIPSKRVAGVSAAGLRLEPADRDTTIGFVDFWADESGVPLQVEVTAKGGSSPVIMARFLEFSLGSPVMTPPENAPFEVGNEPDISPILASLGLTTPPLQLAGRELHDLVLPGIGVYGYGLSSFVVIQLPRDIANSAIDAATKAGAKTAENTVSLDIPPLSLVVVRAARSRRTYLLAGLVSGQVLAQAGAELSVLPRGNR